MISNLVSYIQHTIVIVSPCVESPDVSGTLNIIGDVENARIKNGRLQNECGSKLQGVNFRFGMWELKMQHYNIWKKQQ